MYQVHGDDLIVGQGGFSCNHPRTLQVLHPQPLLLANDVSDLVPAGEETSDIMTWPGM